MQGHQDPTPHTTSYEVKVCKIKLLITNPFSFTLRQPGPHREVLFIQPKHDFRSTTVSQNDF